MLVKDKKTRAAKNLEYFWFNSVKNIYIYIDTNDRIYVDFNIDWNLSTDTGMLIPAKAKRTNTR
jgi:hypothetical protein